MDSWEQYQKADALQQEIADLMWVKEAAVGPAFVSFYGSFYLPAAEAAPRLTERLRSRGYVFQLSAQPLALPGQGAGAGNEYRLEIAIQPLMVKRSRIWINILLMILTVIFTVLAGAGTFSSWPFDFLKPFYDPKALGEGILYSSSLLIILATHELGHYIVSRKRGINATLPYFLPAPSLFGTFGAFIKMKSPVPNRNSLVEVGVAGPIAGFVVAIPVLVAGLLLSDVVMIKGTPSLNLGDNLLLYLLTKLIFGTLPPHYDIALHPVAFAGWIGLLVTAFNLLPMGQLDGGHIVYGLFGKKHLWIARATLAALLLMGIFWQGWFVWGFLALIMGLRHPQPMDDVTPLDGTRKLLGWIALAILVLCFTPVPFSISE
jgi:hypothetical protein